MSPMMDRKRKTIDLTAMSTNGITAKLEYDDIGLWRVKLVFGKMQAAL